MKDGSAPFYNRKAPPVLRKLAGFKGHLKSLFGHDLGLPRRERRNMVKLCELLVEEGYTGSCSPICWFIKALKDDGSRLSKAFIPLYFAPGDALQFDWS